MTPDVVMLRLEVEDSGPGIPKDKLDEIFETFVQLEHDPNAKEALAWAWPLPVRW